MKPPRPVYVIAFRPEPRVDGIKAMRRLLKHALRFHGLRCVDIREGKPAQNAAGLKRRAAA